MDGGVWSRRTRVRSVPVASSSSSAIGATSSLPTPRGSTVPRTAPVVRVGIGRPPGRMDVADFVLRPFTKPEQDVLPLHVDRAADAVEKLVTDGLAPAQQAFH